MYENQLKAIHKANRYRKRELFENNLIDLASNDYLGFAEDKEMLDEAYTIVRSYTSHAPKASQLVNGYHPIHKAFEEALCEANGFEEAIIVGSGFLANLSMIEALPRKKDLLIMDEAYHASGIVASKLVDAKVLTFRHNDPDDLEEILKTEIYERAIICVEGIYSMHADMMEKKIFEIADEYGALLIVDEAHSSGVVGEKLLGVFEHYNITPKPNHIKMGTLGKAYGSYGAYILASSQIIDFLQNRAKAIIYATAPSVFDTALGIVALKRLQVNHKELAQKIDERQKIVKEILGISMQGLILNIDIESSKQALRIKEMVKEKGYLIGAIRPPTVESPILRIIPRVNVPIEKISELLKVINDEM